jgi:hypothetical protein
VFIPNSAFADMMERITPGDMLFLVVKMLLILATGVSLLLWLITLFIKRIKKVNRALGRAIQVLGVSLFLTIILGQIYYHYLGYGAYQKERNKRLNTHFLLRWYMVYMK